MANVMIDIAAEFVGNKAFKQADTATEKLTKNVKQLAGAFGLAFSTTAVLAFGKASIKAAAADQKAQQQLALALKNVGLERDAASSEAYIQSLQTQFGIVDDLLRPAYQTLAIATRDTAESQRLLNLSLDISAATGKDLGSVTTALSRAFLGNNTALTRLGVGISKADLKTKSFYDITTDLASTFKGSATAAAATFQGSIDKLGVAAANVQEIIGTGLIDALKGLGEENSVDDLAKSMESAALYTADVIRGLGVLTQKLKSLPGVGNFNIGMIPIVGSYLEILRGLGKQSTTKPFTTPMTISGQSQQSTQITKDQAKVAKETLKISKDQLKLAKAKAIFDIQKIQIEAALKGKISEEERIRLMLLKAIAEENIDDIDKYTKMLSEVQGKVTDLQSTLAEVYAMDAGNPFISWEEGLDGVTRALIDINGQSIALTSTIAQNSLAMGLAGGASFAQALSGARYAAQAAASMGITGTIGGIPAGVSGAASAGAAGAAGGTVVNVVVQGTLTTEAELKQSIVDAVTNSGLTGNVLITGTPERQVSI
jgi:hypothetical protein